MVIGGGSVTGIVDGRTATKEQIGLLMTKSKHQLANETKRRPNPMSNSQKAVKEPLIHITKRDGIVWWKSWLIRCSRIVAALIVSALVIVLLTKLNPVSVYQSMFKRQLRHKQKVLEYASKPRHAAHNFSCRYPRF